MLRAALLEPGCLGHSARGAWVWCGRTGVDVTSPGQSRELPPRAPSNPPVSVPNHAGELLSRGAYLLTGEIWDDVGSPSLGHSSLAERACLWKS